MSHGTWAVLLSFGVIQGVLLAGALSIKRGGRRLANLLMAATVIGMTSVVAYWFLIAAGRFEFVPPVIYFARVASPAVAPLFYYYAKTLLYPDPRFRGEQEARWSRVGLGQRAFLWGKYG